MTFTGSTRPLLLSPRLMSNQSETRPAFERRECSVAPGAHASGSVLVSTVRDSQTALRSPIAIHTCLTAHNGLMATPCTHSEGAGAFRSPRRYHRRLLSSPRGSGIGLQSQPDGDTASKLRQGDDRANTDSVKLHAPSSPNWTHLAAGAVEIGVALLSGAQMVRSSAPLPARRTWRRRSGVHAARCALPLISVCVHPKTEMTSGLQTT